MKQDYENKDKAKNGRGEQAFNWPKDTKFFDEKQYGTTQHLNIIPYNMATKNHPEVKAKQRKIGDSDFMLDVFVHQFVGPTKADVICPNKTYNRMDACPICAKRAEFYNKGMKKEGGALAPKHYAIYNVVDMDNPDEGIQILRASYTNFHEELREEAGASGNKETGDICDYVDIDDGHSFTFRIVKASFTNDEGKGYPYPEFKKFNFEERDAKEIKLLKKLEPNALSLDSFMVIKAKEEIEQLFYGDLDDDESSDTSEDEDTDSDDEDEKPKTKGKTKKPVIEDDEEDEDDDSDDEEDTDESDEDEEEESDEDEEDDEPAPKAKAKQVAKKTTVGKPVTVFKCPSKHVFGKDCDKFPDDCSDCDIWADCAKEQKKLKAKK